MRICISFLALVVQPVISYDTNFVDVTSTDTGKDTAMHNLEICGYTKLPKDYRGNINKTITGRTCQKWGVQSPQRHLMIAEEYTKADLVDNFCRNPDEDPAGAWCYTTDIKKRWEYCGEKNFSLGSETTLQKDYRGTINKTRTGWTCKKWPDRTVKNYPGAGLIENFCRNPEGDSGGAWCFSTDPNEHWEYCEVADCRSTCAKTTSQKDYRGTINKTITGRTCQQWGVQYPHKNDRSSKKNPKYGLVENFCRNPSDDPNGVWCFTTDPNKRAELCDVPKCPSLVEK